MPAEPEFADLAIPTAALIGLGADSSSLQGMRRGVEKESLRVGADGRLSLKPHPRALGSPLAHPQITTDFSEAQLELITAPSDTPEGCLGELCGIHNFVYAGLEDELLWAASMPCLLVADEEIPIGRYGKSHIGMAKTVYRRGLGHRYGRRMQTISGIHYNFSLPQGFWRSYAALKGRRHDQAFITEGYFALIRNFRRHGWLLIYLFGASPAICRSFAPDGGHGLKSFDPSTLYLPHATSLRMGRLGYQSDAQGQLYISYNSLDSYAATMREALTRPYPPYEAIGVQVDGAYRQLSTTLLQIENEFYGAIRPKRRIQAGERPLTALRRRGVEYVEVRCLDINPFLPVGLDAEQMRFLDTFLLYCLLAPSPPDSAEESRSVQADQAAIVTRGRAPGLKLSGGARDHWGSAILQQCAAVAELLDGAYGSDLYSSALVQQHARLADPALTPSAAILAALAEERMPFFRFARGRSRSHRDWFRGHPLPAQTLAGHEARATQSLADQAHMEAQEVRSFPAFLQDYLRLPE